MLTFLPTLLLVVIYYFLILVVEGSLAPGFLDFIGPLPNFFFLFSVSGPADGRSLSPYFFCFNGISGPPGFTLCH